MASALSKHPFLSLNCVHSHDSARNHLTQQDLPVMHLLLSLGEERRKHGCFLSLGNLRPPNSPHGCRAITEATTGGCGSSTIDYYLSALLQLTGVEREGSLHFVTGSKNQAPAIKFA